MPAGRDADPAAVAVATVVSAVLTPLAHRDERRSKFSRAALPPSQRRARATGSPQRDATGLAFVPVTVEARYGLMPDDRWRMEVTGCVYVATQEVFIKRGGQHRPAAFLLGKRTPPAPDHTCVAKDGAEVAAATPPPR